MPDTFRHKGAALRYSVFQISPKDLLHFVETSEFTASWKELGLNDEDDLASLQFLIMHAPKDSPVVGGTGGLRKLRYSPPAWHRGTSGAVRVCYVYFEKYGVILLVIAYGKNVKANLTASEKLGIKQYISRAELELDRLHAR